MFKKYIISGIVLSALASSLLASSPVTRGDNELAYSKEGAFEYDAVNGWWWYKQLAKDQNGKDVEIKEKITTKEKLSIEKEKEVVKLLKKQIEKLDAVKERLEYAYPNITPIYSTDAKGKKCVTNSSTDCFVFPLQAEAQHVPVLAAWLSDPSPTNSRNWLQWEAKYFNHLQKISLGNRFAFLSGGADAYPTDTTDVYSANPSRNLPAKAKIERELKIIDTASDKLGLMFFMGGNTVLENSVDTYKKMREFNDKPWTKINTVVVVQSKEMKDNLIQKIKLIPIKSTQEFWNNVTWKISPEAFTNFDIAITPSVVATYKTKENKIIWQNIFSGSVEAEDVRGALIRFMVYNNIVNPVEMSSAINSATVQRNMSTNTPVLNEDNIYKDSNTLNKK